MKKSKYISKYDFIAYYSKPKAFWFFTNAELEAAIKINYQKSNFDVFQLENEDEEEFDEEVDVLDRYKELLDENSNIDKNNPLIIEGQIVDNNSRAHIISLFDQNFMVIDWDKRYQNKTNEEKAIITLELINHYHLKYK